MARKLEIVENRYRPQNFRSSQKNLRPGHSYQIKVRCGGWAGGGLMECVIISTWCYTSSGFFKKYVKNACLGILNCLGEQGSGFFRLLTWKIHVQTLILCVRDPNQTKQTFVPLTGRSKWGSYHSKIWDSLKNNKKKHWTVCLICRISFYTPGLQLRWDPAGPSESCRRWHLPHTATCSKNKTQKPHHNRILCRNKQGAGGTNESLINIVCGLSWRFQENEAVTLCKLLPFFGAYLQRRRSRICQPILFVNRGGGGEISRGKNKSQTAFEQRKSATCSPTQANLTEEMNVSGIHPWDRTLIQKYLLLSKAYWSIPISATQITIPNKSWGLQLFWRRCGFAKNWP